MLRILLVLSGGLLCFLLPQMKAQSANGPGGEPEKSTTTADLPEQQSAGAPPAPNTAPDNPTTPAANAAVTGGFFNRLIQAYRDDWHPAPDNSQPPGFRGYPTPATNPPFPFTVWPMGGTVAIGYPNATSYPLTTALQTGPHGDWWKKVNVQIYGWVDVGFNIMGI